MGIMEWSVVILSFIASSLGLIGITFLAVLAERHDKERWKGNENKI